MFNGVGEYQGNGIWKNIGNIDGEPPRLVYYHDGNSPAIYALGYFSGIGEATTGGFAKWDGVRWSNPWPPPISIGNGARCAVVWDDGFGPAIYTNLRPQINGVVHTGIHRWTAEGWEVVFEFPISTQIHDMKVFDDGRGPALYLSGLFDMIGGVAAKNIARWDGKTIEPLGAGVGSLSRQMLVIETARGRALFAKTGTTAGGGTVQRAAIWVGCPNCYADCNLDGQLTVADFACFTAKLSQNDPYANCTVDGQIDVADYICFISRYAAGCP
ncbi:MAG: GC-type dockerin domain-anchored protein [Phycisphaerales bacterium]